MMIETYEQMLARSLVGKSKDEMTEQERAAKIIEDRERLKKHDTRFATGFLNMGEERLISRTLAKQYGLNISPPDNADEGDLGGMK